MHNLRNRTFGAAMNQPTQERDVVSVPTKDLWFDPQNPRFGGHYDLQDQPTDEVIERMIRSENLQELMDSIGEQGYFAGEPLLVSPADEARGGPPYIVIEGNRRLAALKLLNGDLDSANLLPSIRAAREAAKIKPTTVPCIVFNARNDILKYLGFRHITGAKRWDPLSKARYLAQLRDNFYSTLSKEEQLTAIARDIGSRKDYVGQILASLNVYEKARHSKFFGLQRVDAEDVDFSVLSTALSYRNIAEFVGLEGRFDVDGENFSAEKARELFSWMFAQNESGETALGESRNLRYLAAVVSNPTALASFKETRNLHDAFLRTAGPGEALTQALKAAHTKLVTSQDLMRNLEKLEEDHIAQFKKIAELAADLELLAERAFRKSKRAAELDE